MAGGVAFFAGLASMVFAPIVSAGVGVALFECLGLTWAPPVGLAFFGGLILAGAGFSAWFVWLVRDWWRASG